VSNARSGDKSIGSSFSSHFQWNDNQFEISFEKGGFPPSLFTHEAHLRLAWIYLKKYRERRAIEKLCTELEQFDQIHGDGKKFHKTITVAAVKIVHHWAKNSKSQDFTSFIRAFPRLKNAFRELLHCHYSVHVLASKKAKVQYMRPDRLPFL